MKKTIKIGKQKKVSADGEVMTLMGKSGHIIIVLDDYQHKIKAIDNMIKGDFDYGLDEGTREVAIEMLDELLEDYVHLGRLFEGLKKELEKGRV